MALYNFTEHATVQALPIEARGAYALMGDKVAANHQDYWPLYEGHDFFSQTAIQRSAEIALERKPKGAEAQALLLGAGACFDIPLTFIVEHFDRTVVVDVNTRPTASAISQLPASLQSKIHLVEADLTGVAAQVSRGTKELATAMPSYEAFVGPGASMISRISTEGAAPFLGRGYQLAVSQLVASQLPASLGVLADQQLLDAYNRVSSHDLSAPDGLFVGALRELGRQVEASHVDQLASHIGATGIVHFSDSFLMSPTGEIEPAAFRLLDPERFELVGGVIPEWEWPMEPGRILAVTAQTLALRSADGV